MLMVYSMVMIYDKIMPTDSRGLDSLAFDVKVIKWKWFVCSLFMIFYLKIQHLYLSYNLMHLIYTKDIDSRLVCYK